jgi:hypothetical protein
MAWIILVVAGLFEVGWAIGLKWVYPVVAYDLDGSGNSRRSLVIGNCYEVASRGHCVQRLGRRGSGRHGRPRDRVARRAGKPREADQHCAHHHWNHWP